MKSFLSLTKQELLTLQEALLKEYNTYQQRNLKLDMSRGKPGNEQLEISQPMLDIVSSSSDCKTRDGLDCRNYGLLDGLPSIKELFSVMLEVDPENIMVGGNSSLNMMFDTIACMMTTGIGGCTPWCKLERVKFLCPVPGYDRHFGITEYFGIEMIPVPMTDKGPDMDLVEKLVSSDDAIKGIWCVPKYSNPQGITYSDETVRRFARLKPAAKDFRIMWDNAYCVHDITDHSDKLLSIMDECVKNGTEDLPVLFCSTSKITFPGSGVAAMAASKANMQVFKERYKYQTIGFDKINMLRHMLFFKNMDGVLLHMQKHKKILAPKFQSVLDHLENSLSGTDTATWIAPNGGYFVSVDVMEGCAKRVVQLCKEAGVVLTGAGATFPYGKDPKDSNIRIAPTYPPVDELNIAMDLFCLCVKIAAVEKLLCQ
ncbi:MAG: aminotransferase class I/II-fold pyridoxal phosphate-dependent enzyme [Acutalibacteraceae bacterium]|nr:aminotransferase class I/II-fold pyridoxal phosphate-dependent enzyme [Acutalibacteraceae bacterium]HIR02451.1 aminotransferase class I/II-fold pyridoxal phosphate-dependent enzyme [Candidatus Scatovicinus merdipullorum]